MAVGQVQQVDDRLCQEMDTDEAGDDVHHKVGFAGDFAAFSAMPGRDDGADDADDIGFVTLDKRNNQGQGIDHG